MTRIIAGVARGRRLVVPTGAATRPTADRAREALFSSLESLRGPLLGARVLDLYAGTGAVGLEALSRGAALVTLVESSPLVAAALRRNIAVVGLPGAVVLVAPVEALVAASPSGTAAAGPHDVVFLDPPYALAAERVREVVTSLRANRWLSLDGVVVVERASRDATWIWPDGVLAERSRPYGEATLWYGRAADMNGPPDLHQA